MNAEELKSLQAPLKQKYKDQPETAMVTLKANARIGEGITCKIETGKALVVAGLCAQGTTEIEHSEVIRRGYERVDQRLAELGANIFSEL